MRIEPRCNDLPCLSRTCPADAVSLGIAAYNRQGESCYLMGLISR